MYDVHARANACERYGRDDRDDHGRDDARAADRVDGYGDHGPRESAFSGCVSQRHLARDLQFDRDDDVRERAHDHDHGDAYVKREHDRVRENDRVRGRVHRDRDDVDQRKPNDLHPGADALRQALLLSKQVMRSASKHLPWKMNIPATLVHRPTHPTMTTNSGSETSTLPFK